MASASVHSVHTIDIHRQECIESDGQPLYHESSARCVTTPPGGMTCSVSAEIKRGQHSSDSAEVSYGRNFAEHDGEEEVVADVWSHLDEEPHPTEGSHRRPGQAHDNDDENDLDRSDATEAGHHGDTQGHLEGWYSTFLPGEVIDTNNSRFLGYLKSLVIDATRRIADPLLENTPFSDGAHGLEQVLLISWAICVAYERADAEVPACVVVTSEKLCCFEVKKLPACAADAAAPSLDSLFIVLLQNVQRFVVGPFRLGVRVEQAFEDARGLFTILFFDAERTDEFLETFERAYSLKTKTTDMPPLPDVVSHQKQLEKKLKNTLNAYEGFPTSDMVEILQYHHCRVENSLLRVYTIVAVALTSSVMYIVQEDFVNYPAPLFAENGQKGCQFQVLHAYSVSAVQSIQKFDRRCFSFYLYGAEVATSSVEDEQVGVVGLTFHQEETRETFVHEMQRCRDEYQLESDATYSARRRTSRLVKQRNMDSSSSGASQNVQPENSQCHALEICNEDDSVFYDDTVKLHGQESSEYNLLDSRSGIGQPNLDAVLRNNSQDLGDMGSRESTDLWDDVYLIAGSDLEQAERSSRQCFVVEKPSPLEQSAVNGTETRVDAPAATAVDGASDPSCTVRVFCRCPTEDQAPPSGSSEGDTAGLNATPEGEGQVCGSRTTAVQFYLPENSTSSKQNNGSDSLINKHKDEGSLERGSPSPRETPSRKYVQFSPETKSDGLHQAPKSPLGLVLLLSYPGEHLLHHLSQCFETVNYLPDLPPALCHLPLLSPREFVRYFHQHVAQSDGAEEVRHLLWTHVMLHGAADSCERPSCVVMTTRGIYFLFVDSESTPLAVNKDGFVAKVLTFKQIKQVNVGLMEHKFRLTGSSPETTVACVTRSATYTQTFLDKLTACLSGLLPTPSPDTPGSGNSSECDIYSSFRNAGDSTSTDFTHPSRVRFVYQNDDAVSELTFLIAGRAAGLKTSQDDVVFVAAFLVYQQTGGGLEPKTLVLTDSFCALCLEDHLHYPIPDFARNVPEHYRFENFSVHRIDAIRCVTTNGNAVLLVVFLDESYFVVDVTREHFSARGGKAVSGHSTPLVTWCLRFYSDADWEQCLKMLRQLYKECCGGKELRLSSSADEA